MDSKFLNEMNNNSDIIEMECVRILSVLQKKYNFKVVDKNNTLLFMKIAMEGNLSKTQTAVNLKIKDLLSEDEIVEALSATFKAQYQILNAINGKYYNQVDIKEDFLTEDTLTNQHIKRLEKNEDLMSLLHEMRNHTLGEDYYESEVLSLMSSLLI